MRAFVAGVVACVALLAAGMALGAASFSDSVGDDNAAPDITAVNVSEASEILTVRVRVRNYQALPTGSWFNVWFDLDRNDQTGDIAGDESMVRYFATGALEHYVYNGTEWVEAPATGVSGAYGAGVLTLTIPKSLLGSSNFGILAVAARGQQLSGELFVAADLAPNSGRSPFTSPTPGDFPDPANDQNAAPDIAKVSVTDKKDGWIRFAITTPNRVTLPRQSVLILAIDRDNKPTTGASGAEVSITDLGGVMQLERWDPRLRRFVEDRGPTRLREGSKDNVITVQIHRSELDDAPRFGFRLAAADLDTATGDVVAIDFAPNGGTFWRYKLANPAAVRLVAGKVSAVPAKPRAGRSFIFKRTVTRSDTSAAVTSGRVTCSAQLAGKRLVAKGALVRGGGRCLVTIPSGTKGQRLRGSLTVRSGGASLTSKFTYIVR